MTTFEYLKTLTPEQMKEAVHAMSPEARRVLIGEVCGEVSKLVAHVVQNADEIWENR